MQGVCGVAVEGKDSRTRRKRENSREGEVKCTFVAVSVREKKKIERYDVDGEESRGGARSA